MCSQRDETLELARRNRLLAALPEVDLARLVPQLDHVELVEGNVIMRAGKSFPDVYFPIDCIIFMTRNPADTRAVKIAIIGNEGVAGIFAVLGRASMPLDACVQVPGEALRMRVSAFQAEAARCEALDDLLRRYLQALFADVAQAVMCNRLHTVEGRLATWLLVMRRRSRQTAFALTQDSLAYLLGTRRATVAATLGVFKRAGHIEHRRGEIAILDEAGLENAACTCLDFNERCFDQAFEDVL